MSATFKLSMERIAELKAAAPEECWDITNAELADLCDLAEEALRHRDIVEAARAWLAQAPELRRSGEIDLANAIEAVKP